MTEPTGGPRDQRLDEGTMTTEMLRGMRQLESVDAQSVQETQEPEPRYVKEPLFSKKVMFGWGLATLVVWFAFTFVIPAVVDSVRVAIASHIPRDENSRTVIRTRNGTVTITRSGDGITVDRKGNGEVAPIAPVVEPAEPAEPAPVAEPAPAAQKVGERPAPPRTPIEKK